LEGQLGKRLSEEAMRKTLQRARDDYADHLIDEVGHSLRTTSLDRIEDELRDLGLWPQCGSRLDRRRGGYAIASHPARRMLPGNAKASASRERGSSCRTVIPVGTT